MNKISAKDVAKLREQTGVGMMTAKKALTEAGGDFVKAEELLNKEAKKKVSKKKDREIKSGFIDAYTHDGRVGVLLKMGTETDFVAKNEDFREVTHDITLQIASMDPKDPEELLEQSFIKDQDKTIRQLLESLVAKIGERIEIIEFTRYEI
jgi:elongation factor Ts